MFLVLNLAGNGRNQRCSRTAQDNYRLTTPSLLSRGTLMFIDYGECLPGPPAKTASLPDIAIRIISKGLYPGGMGTLFPVLEFHHDFRANLRDSDPPSTYTTK